jgi:hypothetical protein
MEPAYQLNLFEVVRESPVRGIIAVTGEVSAWERQEETVEHPTRVWVDPYL